MKAEEYFELAANEVRRKKFKKAASFFVKTLARDPEHVEARKGLRAVALQEFTGKAFNVALSNLGVIFAISLCKMKKKHKDGMQRCTEYLAVNPNSPFALRKLIDFAEEEKKKKTMAHTYQVLAEVKPEDADLIVEAADFLSDQGDVELYEKAVTLMAKLCSENPDDTDLSGERNRIEAKKVVNKLETAESQADVLKDKDAAKKLEEESQQIRTADDLERAIERALAREKEEPESARAKEVLADLFFRKGLLVEAIEKFDESIAIDPNNNSVVSRRGDAVIKQLDNAVKSMEKRLPKLEGAELDDTKVRLKEAKKKLREGKFNEFNRRLKINPNDLPTRFDLGVLFYQTKDFDSAIQQFQRSVQDARLSFRSNQYLGHSFKQKKLWDMAIKEFQNASKRPTASGKDRLSVVYETAVCYEMSGRKPEALEVFKSILEKDFGFKDVAARVEALSQEA